MKRFVIIFILLIAVSCSYDKIYENRISDKNDAQKVVNNFYYLTKKSDREKIFKLFSKRFFQELEKDKFEEILNRTERDFGKVKNAELTNSWTQIVDGSNPISKYELSYIVTRDSAQTKEYFRLQKENDTIKIISYRLDFDLTEKK